jgi:hypothetical protein
MEATFSAEIVVYGGTAAGVMAAVQSARLGRTVALLEPGQHFGGISVEGLGSSDIDNHKEFKNGSAVGGLAKEFYKKIGAEYAKDSPVYRFESSIAERVIQKLLNHPKITLFRGARLKENRGVTKQGTQIIQIHTENNKTFTGKIFIDATIEGDLLNASGVTMFNGREGNAKYGETKNGIRAENTYRQFAVRVDPYRTPGSSRSGVIPTIQDEPLGNPGEGDSRIQGYCFRLCLTDNPQNLLPFTKPDGYDPATYEIYRRYVRAGGKLWKPSANLPHRKTDLGSWHDLSANLYGMNHAYPTGSYTVRTQVYQEHLHFTQGLLWFLANDRDLPDDLRSEWSRWGVCQDEFTDNGGYPRQFYVREARRMVSDYVLTEHHTRRKEQIPVHDPVCLSYWPPDTHHVRRIIRDGAAYNEGFVFGGDDWAAFGISYQSLVPRRNECTNLITPTCLSSTHVAYGAIRLEWTFMCLGQSAAMAASLALAGNISVQAVDYPTLRQQLLQVGQVLELPPSPVESTVEGA